MIATQFIAKWYPLDLLKASATRAHVNDRCAELFGRATSWKAMLGGVFLTGMLWR